VVGEVLFQADYALKEVCIGDLKLPGIPHIFEDNQMFDSATAARQWFVIRDSDVTVAADGALIPYCQMGVDCRRLVPSAKGYVDADYTDPREPSVQIAAAVSKHFAEVASQVAVVNELMAVAKATIVARFLLERGCHMNSEVIDSLTLPVCPEGNKYTMEIPTLRTERRTATVSDVDGSLVLQKQQRSVHGGVDLGCKVKKIPVKEIPQRILEPDQLPTLLPLFRHRAAKAGA